MNRTKKEQSELVLRELQFITLISNNLRDLITAQSKIEQYSTGLAEIENRLNHYPDIINTNDLKNRIFSLKIILENLVQRN